MNTSPEIPDAERAYLAFQDQFSGGLSALDAVQADFRWSDAPERRVDPRVHYPLDMTIELAKTIAPDLPGTDDRSLGQFLHAFGNFRLTRTIYTIDRTLFAHLVRSKWPADIPVSAAALPKNGCVLDLPAHEVFGVENIQGASRIQVICTYDMNPETGDLDLVLSAFCIRHKEPGRPMFALSNLDAWVDLSAPSLEEAILRHAIYIEGAPARIKEWVDSGVASHYEPLNDEQLKATEDQFFSKEWFLYLKSVLSVLLYINGNDDCLEMEAPSQVPMNRAARRRAEKVKPGRGPSDPPLRSFKVGAGFASVIQRWEAQEHQDSEANGKTVRPHLRAAHAHTYRVGPGRTGVRVKFLPPIPVKGWAAPEANLANRLVK